MTELMRPLGHVLQTIDLLLRLGDIDRAIQVIDLVAEIYPDLVALQIFRGWVALNQGNRTRAVAAFRLAAGRDPTDPLVWHGIAEASPDEGERTAAIERAELLSPDGPQAYIWHDLKLGKVHLAVTPIHAFSRRFPQRAELAIWFAEAQRRLGNDAAARATLDPLLRRRPRPAPVAFLAAALSHDGVQAQQFLDDALRLDPLASSATRLFAPTPVPFRIP
ncbi:MAG TPA: tetratricopeptide repeat protein, partial [Herpetosiphonaceae bacterium]|nr:tetratricopeptide repeat protein [Herpetosiphonaceae bacterium]